MRNKIAYDSVYKTPECVKAFIATAQLPKPFNMKVYSSNRSISLYHDITLIASITYELIENCETRVADALLQDIVSKYDFSKVTCEQ